MIGMEESLNKLTRGCYTLVVRGRQVAVVVIVVVILVVSIVVVVAV